MEFIVSHADDPNHLLLESQNFLSTLLMARNEDLLYYIDDQLHKANVDCEKIHTEFCGSQFEMCLRPRFGIEAADGVFRFRESVKELCETKGLKASFMAKPFSGEFVCSAMHFNFR